MTNFPQTLQLGVTYDSYLIFSVGQVLGARLTWALFGLCCSGLTGGWVLFQAHGDVGRERGSCAGVQFSVVPAPGTFSNLFSFLKFALKISFSCNSCNYAFGNNNSDGTGTHNIEMGFFSARLPSLISRSNRS